MSSDESLKQELVDAIRMLERAEYIDHNGHASARRDQTTFFINSGASVRSALTTADIVAADLDGNLVEGTARPPLEFHLHAAISLFARTDAPVIAAVQGAAAGAGMSLVCACDLVVAGESARFAMAYTRAGLSPDGSGTWFLPRLVGRQRALELMLTNRMLSAQEALEWGIVTRVVPDAEVEAAARKLAGELAAGPTRAYGLVKRLVLSSASESLETQMELEAAGIADSAASADGREGIAAFLGKRAPTFRGA